MAERNIKVIIGYNGSAYHGWQKQPDRPTVQGTIEDALVKLCGKNVQVCGTSRTDAGVHAFGQVARIVIDSPIPTCNLKRAMNQYLPDDIVFNEVEDAPDDFDPIGGPKSKHYQYKIYTSKNKPVFHQNLCWYYPYSIDEQRMNVAAKKFEGTKDFKSFASAKDYRTDSIRTIMKCEVVRDNDWVIIDVIGNRFMYNMVRNMVGTLVDVGRGHWEPEKIDEIFEARNRRAAGILAPASGLYLMKINF